MMPIDIMFIIEHKDREYDTVKEIAEKLHNVMGLSSIVVSMYYHTDYILKYNPKVYVVPYFIEVDDFPNDLIYFFKKEESKIINLCWEQYLSSSNKEFKRPKDLITKEEIYHIAWEESFKVDFLQCYGINEKNIYISGNPNVSRLFNNLKNKKKLRRYISSKYSLDESKEWLFLPMNYGWAFSSDSVIKKKIKRGYSFEDAWEYKRYSKKCLREFIIWLADVSRIYDYELIVRPHPSISVDDYSNVIKKYYPNLLDEILINKDLSVNEWIIASDLVGSSWSTCVYDAYCIGKKAFLFTPFERPSFLEVDWNKKVSNISDAFSIKRLDRTEIRNININVVDKFVSIINEVYYSDISFKKKMSKLKLRTVLKIFRAILGRRFNIGFTKKLKYDNFEILLFKD